MNIANRNLLQGSATQAWLSQAGRAPPRPACSRRPGGCLAGAAPAVHGDLRATCRAPAGTRVWPHPLAGRRRAGRPGAAGTAGWRRRQHKQPAGRSGGSRAGAAGAAGSAAPPAAAASSHAGRWRGRRGAADAGGGAAAGQRGGCSSRPGKRGTWCKLRGTGVPPCAALLARGAAAAGRRQQRRGAGGQEEAAWGCPGPGGHCGCCASAGGCSTGFSITPPCSLIEFNLQHCACHVCADMT